jgi:UDP-N-acetylglucosamine:LPS N-acetylglucosamine transferase
MASKVTIISGSVGAGHDGVADELTRRLRELGCSVTQWDFLNLLGPKFGPALRRGYAKELSTVPRTWGWFLGQLQRHSVLAGAVRWIVNWLAGARTRAVLDPAPDLVISVYPLASQVLGRLRRQGELTAPVVTFLTDMSVHALWVAPGIDLHLALHEVAADQARAQGAALVRVGGAVVRPRFRPDADPGERAEVRAAHGIPADHPAALILAGSWGVGDILATASDVAASGVATPVVVCGSNEALRAELTGRGLGVALGWIDDLAPVLRACDVVVQNAGGLSSLEAMACGVPVLSYRCLPGHGETNAAALAAAGLAEWPADPAALLDALKLAVDDPTRAVPEVVSGDPLRLILELLPADTATEVPA